MANVSNLAAKQERLAPKNICRFCQGHLSQTLCDLGMSPPSNRYLREDQLKDMEPFYPLHAYVCDKCFLVQLEQFHTAEEIFAHDYAYFSSYSSSWMAHCQRYCEQMQKQYGIGKSSLVIEIASNDGYLLQNFVKAGIPALGIEPAANVAKVAIEKCVPTRVEFFGVACAKKLVAEGRQADLLLGNNVLAHVPDLNDFVLGLKILLAPKGVITFEFPHLLKLMEENQFDTIYHEHFCYFSLLAISKVFAHHGLTIFDVEELPTHGGSLRIHACHQGHRTLTDGYQDVLKKELTFGLDQISTYEKFAQQVRVTKQKLLEFLIEAKQQGKKIAGYGAAAKGNTLLNYCGIRGDFLDYVVDLNPHKQNMFLPGTHIPIYAPEKIKETKPDYVLILPWNIRDEVANTHAYIKEWGGKFVVPIPTVKVL
ncbi:MAG: methyltransferase domain-containing protein [Alphaproteobacteria bacterium]|nr:MAG: methyltransferase domain-containing protein [Alphaproteobacteria bacterium]